MKTVASAPHKAILTGEHAVVYGVPAVATSLDLKTHVKVEQLENEPPSIFSVNLNKKWLLENRPPKKFEYLHRILQIFKDHFLHDPIPNLQITIRSDVEPGCGLGTSASTAAAVTGALSKALELNLDKETINSIAFEAEKVTHGTPSGIDNTITTFGGLLAYSPQRRREEKIRLMDDAPKFFLLLMDSGQENLTRKAVEKVRKLYDQKKQMVKKVFKKIWKISEDVWYQFHHDLNWEKIGELMTKNHRLLKKIGVSNHMLDKLTNIAREAGCFGAKLTGGGLGGYVIALPPQGREKIIKRRIKDKISNVKVVSNSLTGVQASKREGDG